MNKRILFVLKLVVVFIFTLSCEKEIVVTDAYFPLGRICVLKNNLAVEANNQDLIYEIVYDSCGGYWLHFDATQLEGDADVTVRYTRTYQRAEGFIDSTYLENWLKASHYIDCDNDEIKRKALEIADESDSNMIKALKIHRYVIDSIQFYEDYHKPADVKASKTLKEGAGVCINYSRLYVALCRAAGVPARSVWGVVYADFDKTYYYHHQWAEICDEDGKWHICDLTKEEEFFNNNIEYLDLVYGAEENSRIFGHTDWIYLLNEVDYWHSCPVATKGKIPGFELIANNKPDSLVVEYVIQF